MADKIRIGIFGAAGYSGEELIRLLLTHPSAEISLITSRSNPGKPVGEVFSRFTGLPLKFELPEIETVVSRKLDVVFLALPHGLAHEYAQPILEKGVKVIDISADLRLKSEEKYMEYYGQKHPAPCLLKKAVFGLPEFYRAQIARADVIACPGCYPTSTLLPLIPLLKEKLICIKNIVVSSGSGVSGAGRKVDLPYIFPECNESFRAYSPTGHRHLPEIEQELSFAANEEVRINFIPHLVPMNRGINTTIIAEPVKFDRNAISSAYSQYYVNEKFVRILPEKVYSDTKNVTRTNMCEIGFVLDKHTGKLIITSAIDNLTKGASGQAIQCMNIMFGLDESAGLK